MTNWSFPVEIKGVSLTFETHRRLFSPHQADLGTRAMLVCTEFRPDDKVLDLGCGYGLVGILAAKLIGPDRVVMSDNDDLAVHYAKINAERNGVSGVKIVKSDGFDNLDDAGFSLILCNPPYHVDFSVPKNFVHKGFNRLVVGGRFCMVTKRLLWYKNKLTSIFGGVRIIETDGYYVFTSVKKEMTYAKVLDPRILKRGRKKERPSRTPESWE